MISWTNTEGHKTCTYIYVYILMYMYNNNIDWYMDDVAFSVLCSVDDGMSRAKWMVNMCV